MRRIYDIHPRGTGWLTCLASRRTGQRMAAVLAFAAVLSGFLGGPAAAQTPRARTQPATAGTNRTVLVLLSYHPGHKWTGQIHAGIEEHFATVDPPVRLLVSYMDTKRNVDPEYYGRLARLYAHKYANETIDVVISADNNAFNFARRYGTQIFGQAPIVFCGVNHFDPSMLAGDRPITSVAEYVDVTRTVRLAMALHPGARKLYCIIDRTVTGRAIRRSIEEQLRPIEDLEMHWLDDLRLDELPGVMSNLPEDALVLMLAYNHCPTGRLIETEEVCQLVAANSTAPVYSFQETNLGRGIVGGELYCGSDQGRLAAQLAEQVLAGRNPRDLPVIRHTGGRWIFDARQLKRWGIGENRLPAGAEVRFTPLTFLQRHGRVLAVGGMAVAGLVLLNLLLVGNILRHRRAARALGRSEERFRRLVETMYEGVVVTDADARVVYVNDRFAELTGRTRQSLTGRPLEELLVPAPMDETDDSEGPARPSKAETELLCRDGRRRPVLVSSRPAPPESGLQAGQFAVVTDLTERKTLEEQLHQARRMEAIGRLAGGVAHDFNNQLTVIKGYTEVMQQGPEAPPQLGNAISEIGRAADRAQKLTSQLLSFSRRQMLRPEVVVLNDVVSEMSDSLQRLIGERVELVVRCGDGAGCVRVDRAQLEQALMNLAANARDAMPDGGQVVIATCPAEEEPGGPVWAELTVRDNGLGMDDRTRRMIFEPFFTTKDVGKGTGLGLSMVYGFVRQSGGHVEVQSAPGEGTCVSIRLPRADEASSEAKAHAAQAADPRPPAEGTGTVLVCEDDESVRALAVRMLRRMGYTVLEAGNAREAMPLGEHYDGPIDVLVTDVVMPGMRGPELALQLRRQRPDLAVVFMSGYTAADTPAGGELHGADAPLLTKPFTPEQLAERIDTAVAARRAAAAE